MVSVDRAIRAEFHPYSRAPGVCPILRFSTRSNPNPCLVPSPPPWDGLDCRTKRRYHVLTTPEKAGVDTASGSKPWWGQYGDP